MKRLLLILILTFSLQSLTRADDIRDFEIEGMSIGDSLLDHYNLSEINENIANYYNDNEYTVTELDSDNSDYNLIQVHYKTEDKKLTIYSIDGLFEIKNIQKCIAKKNKISEQMAKLFPTIEKELNSNAKMVSGHGMMHATTFYFPSGDFTEVTCYDYNKKVENERGWEDHGRVAIVNDKLNKWIINKAYK